MNFELGALNFELGRRYGAAEFEKLAVYQLSEDLSDRIWEMVLKWNNLARDTVGKQLIRAADSVGANIAEGTGRGSHLDNRRFVRIAHGSVNETIHWLRRAYRRQLLTASNHEPCNPCFKSYRRDWAPITVRLRRAQSSKIKAQSSTATGEADDRSTNN